jgi:DNA topoisomerase-1
MKLAIVESPSKCGTVQKYLPSDFEVQASLGHIRDLTSDKEDLPKRYRDREWASLGVNVEDDFEPFYITDGDSRETISTLKSKLKKADALYLATDDDREGEAISWHLREVLNPSVPVHRMKFNEITKSAVQKALNQTGDIDRDLVEAQEARRILDRLVGFPLSDFVGEKIKFGLSAGRVQSVAVRLVSDREHLRRQFTEHDHWTIEGVFETPDGLDIKASLDDVDGKRPAETKDFNRQTGEYEGPSTAIWLQEDDVQDLLDDIDNGDWKVESTSERSFASSPKPPFVTSTLQRKASYSLGMSASYTMNVAQSLYEKGLITYHRTDDVSLSKEGLNAARRAAYQSFDDSYVHDDARFYSSSSSSQQAHEAVRPSGSSFTHPNDAGLSGKQYKVYRMIWQRTVASQMADAEKTTITARLTSDQSNRDVTLKASGTRVDDAGFIASYYPSSDSPESDVNEGTPLPTWSQGDRPTLERIEEKQRTTSPPSRFTEPSLIKELEEKNIGRPSTYASILRKVEGRYVRKDGKTMIPTFNGLAVTHLLKRHFPEIVDTGFTADMESSLDDIADGKKDRTSYLESFWTSFKTTLDHARDDVDKDEAQEVPLDDLTYTVKAGYYSCYAEVKENGDVYTVSIPDDIAPDSLADEDIESLLAQKRKSPTQLGRDPDTHQPIYLREGDYGHYLQRGSYDDDDEQDVETISLPDGIEPDDATVDLALRLFSLPRHLGTHPDTGESVETGLGPYGPYIRTGEEGDFNYTSLDDLDDVFSMSLDEAVSTIEKDTIQDFGHHGEKRLRVLKGPYGPYVKHGDQNIGLPDDADPEHISLDDVKKLVDEQE